MAQATTQTGYDKRLGEIRAIWRKDSWLYGLTGLLAGFIMGIAASGALHQFMTWFWDGFWNEALSIAITVVILDRLATNREIEREAKEHKKTLIVQMRSRDNATAINAIAQLEENGWLYDGSLKNAYLRAANFCDARLRQLNKKHGQRKTIILKGVELGYADLRRAELGSVDLQGAKLEVVNFFKARLTHVDLRGANLKMQISETQNYISIVRMRLEDHYSMSIQYCQMVHSTFSMMDLSN